MGILISNVRYIKKKTRMVSANLVGNVQGINLGLKSNKGFLLAIGSNHKS